MDRRGPGKAFSVAVLAGIVGLAFIAVGLYELLDGTFSMLSPTALAYVGAGVMIEAVTLTLWSLRSREGRIFLLTSSFALLQAAFLWTCGLGLPLTNDLFLSMLRVIESLNLTLLGSVSWSFQELDLSFLFALAVCMVSLFLLTGGRSGLSALNALCVTAGLLLELSVMVYLFTPTYVGVPFADAAPAWLTNQVLGIVSGLSLATMTTAEVYIRRLGLLRARREGSVERGPPHLQV